MYLEYCIYNNHITDYSEELNKVFKAIDNGVDGLAVPTHFFLKIKDIIADTVELAIPIDYPMGYTLSKNKINSVLNAGKIGANIIDYTPNSYYLKHDFSKLKNEIKTCLGICKDYDMTFRLFLDHNRSDLKDLIAITKIYYELGVDACFPSIGYHHDDFIDNVINAKLIEEKSNMPMMFNGYLWQKEQLDEILKYDFFGIRVYNYKILV